MYKIDGAYDRGRFGHAVRIYGYNDGSPLGQRLDQCPGPYRERSSSSG